MGYQYLKHSQIEFNKWDDCIYASANGNIYSLSWYLNIVSPGWDGLVEINDSVYTTVMALPSFRKFKMMKFLAQPHFVNQLGIICRQPLQAVELLEILGILQRKFIYISQYPLNVSNQPILNGLELTTLHKKIIVERYNSYQLDLAADYQTVSQHYSADRRQNIARALKNDLTIERSNDITLFIALHKTFNAPKIYGGVSQHQNQLLRLLYRVSNEKGFSEMFFVKKDSSVISTCIFYYFKNQIIKFSNVSTDEGRQYNGDTFLMHSLLPGWSNQNKTLDFERASLPGINHYKESYGAQGVMYSSITYNNLPPLIDLFKRIRYSLLSRKEK